MFANSKKVTTFAPAIERGILDKKDGPFVYRLGRKIFILERGVRFPHGLPNKKAIRILLKNKPCLATRLIHNTNTK